MSLIFLKRSLVFPILFFSSVSLHWSFRKAFLSLLAVLWNSVFRWVYLSFCPLPYASLVFSAIWKASLDSRFAFYISFSWIWFWSPPPVQCLESPSVVLQALSDLIPWIYLPDTWLFDKVRGLRRTYFQLKTVLVIMFPVAVFKQLKFYSSKSQAVTQCLLLEPA